MRQLVYEIASTYKTHKFAENFKELFMLQDVETLSTTGIYSCLAMSRNCRLGSSLLHDVLQLSTRI
jgi:hypothetical protein